MGLKDRKLVNLHGIEGTLSPHQEQIDRALIAKKVALEYVADVSKLAEFIGGKVEFLELGEDWAVSKEIFPGIEVFFIYNRADEELPSSLRVLYSGDRIKMMNGEDLAGITIFYFNHILRYVRETNPGKKLPEVCYLV